MKLCCFTGHRKIPTVDLPTVQKRLQKTIKQLMKQDITTFYCGGALGFDTLAAQAVLKARRFHPRVKLILALPCRDQAEHWREADRLLYESIKRRADEVIYLAERYTRGCMFERNRYMVDHSDVCVCYCLRSRRHGIYGAVCAAQGRSDHQSGKGGMGRKNPLTECQGKTIVMFGFDGATAL